MEFLTIIGTLAQYAMTCVYFSTYVYGFVIFICIAVFIAGMLGEEPSWEHFTRALIWPLHLISLIGLIIAGFFKMVFGE